MESNSGPKSREDCEVDLQEQQSILAIEGKEVQGWQDNGAGFTQPTNEKWIPVPLHRRMECGPPISDTSKKAGASGNLSRVLALGWDLEEIHVTWVHLEKNRTRLRTYTKSLEELSKQCVETTSQA
ncbi:hypothetical protein Tco_0968076 [Tanacetum coccineum]